MPDRHRFIRISGLQFQLPFVFPEISDFSVPEEENTSAACDRHVANHHRSWNHGNIPSVWPDAAWPTSQSSEWEGHSRWVVSGWTDRWRDMKGMLIVGLWWRYVLDCFWQWAYQWSHISGLNITYITDLVFFGLKIGHLTVIIIMRSSPKAFFRVYQKVFLSQTQI